MTDYLNLDDTTDAGDFLSDGYLGLDDPPAPMEAPAPPSAPASGSWGTSAPASDNWLGTGSSDNWLDANNSSAAPQDDWLAEPSHAAAPAAAADHWAGTPTTPVAPVNPAMELSVQAPMLEHVQQSGITVGGARGDLSTLVLDVEVPVEVYFGDAALTVEEFLEMGPGSVVELEHPIQAPIELRVRGKLVARGQLVTINGNYGMRITEMLDGGAR
jgi:flagellar motor switch protein FliN